MSLTSWLVSKLWKLPPAETTKITVRRNLKIQCLTGRIAGRSLYSGFSRFKIACNLNPVPLRQGWSGRSDLRPGFCRTRLPGAAQCTRGTAGSGGEFVFARYEHADGLATLEWIKRQDWFSGELALLGASYLGFVQWAIAAWAGPELKALVPDVTSSDFNHFRYQGGSLVLESILGWSTTMTKQAAYRYKVEFAFQQAPGAGPPGPGL